MTAKATRAPASLSLVVAKLESTYGPPPPPPTVDPWEIILRENVVYLADDESRDHAFRALKAEVGTEPRKILAAPKAKLARISKMGGILADNNVRKLRMAAEIAEKEFPGGLRAVLELPVDKAKRALKKFPGIGDPGAEKILLLNGRLPVLALDSNGLRVLLRLGHGVDGRAYPVMYRTAQASAQEGAPRDPEWLTRAHLILRRHGQETCKNAKPLCESCGLREVCPYPNQKARSSR